MQNKIFAKVVDENHALGMLRDIKQTTKELVQGYADIFLPIIEDAYLQEYNAEQLIQKEIEMF